MNGNPIRNTTADMRGANSLDLNLLLLTGMENGGNVSSFIENQERAGQQQLVRSEMLPTDTSGKDADFEAAGFTFGKPLDDDPMFRPATLPDGWSRQGSDHAMWSYLVDDLGRRRASVFYKAAFYDRSAHMRLTDIDGYVHCHVNGYEGYSDLITDESWATPAAVAESARRQAKGVAEKIAECREWLSSDMPARVDYARKYLPENERRHAQYLALAEAVERGI